MGHNPVQNHIDVVWGVVVGFSALFYMQLVAGSIFSKILKPIINPC